MPEPAAAPTARPAAGGRRIHAIVIGASAGGVEALLTLLPALPAGLAAAVFVVIHLPRHTPSLLAGIFAPACALPVQEAYDKVTVEPGTVYVAPADYHLMVDDLGTRTPAISLSIDPPVHWSRPSIDVLFESAADRYGEHLLGIVLTGWNSDGSDGLRAVQRAGGVTVVQQPTTAHAQTMPESALARVAPDHVLPLDGIAVLLASLGAQAVLPTRTTLPLSQPERPTR